MFEVGLWLAGFGCLFTVAWYAGRQLSERNAMRRMLKRRGYKYTRLLEDTVHGELRPYRTWNRQGRHTPNGIAPDERTRADPVPEKLKRVS